MTATAISKAIDALASAAFIEGGVSPENMDAARSLTEQRRRELLAAITPTAHCLHQIAEPAAQAPAAVAVPDGYALVPIKPTDEMLCALMQWDGETGLSILPQYKPMLAAAPAPADAPAMPAPAADAATQAAQAATEEPAPITFMTVDQACKWGWDDVRKEVGTQGWTTGDSCNFYGFFLWGWNYRGQYELQRAATRSAVMQELTAAPSASAPQAQDVQRDSLTQAARDVLAERARQISAEGWTPEHDDQYRPGELLMAADSYISWNCGEYEPGTAPINWPWKLEWFKPTTERRNLEKAGALILAEIERIDRAAIAASAAQKVGEAPVLPLEGDSTDDDDLSDWQSGTSKPELDGRYLRDFDEGVAISWFTDGEWTKDGFFASDIQDAPWRGLRAASAAKGGEA